MTHTTKKLLIGAHTSIAGGVQNALLEGRDIGATTVQIFTANQRRWDTKAISEESVAVWKKTLQETDLSHIMSHDSYLINLGAPDEENLRKSRIAFKEELHRCEQLGVTYLNFHPGSAIKSGPQACLDLICQSLLELEDLMADKSPRLLLEATAGQGSVVGWRFEELAYIIQKVGNKIPVGVCIDTCHIFVAGYDIRTPEAWDATLKEFDRTIGLEHLYAFHVNDSLKGLGSKVDRHASLGEGTIGKECFKFLMTDPRVKELPKYLETPAGPEKWKEEIMMLREFAGRH